MSLESTQQYGRETTTRRKPPRPPMLSLCAAQTTTFVPKYKNLKQVEEESLSGTNWSMASRRGRQRENCEDRFTCLPFVSKDTHGRPVSIFGIFDGHGGQGAAKFASKRLPELFLSSLQEEEFNRTTLENAFLLVDNEFLELSKSNSEPFNENHRILSNDTTDLESAPYILDKQENPTFNTSLYSSQNESTIIHNDDLVTSPILTPHVLTSTSFSVNNSSTQQDPLTMITPRDTTPTRSVGTTATMIVLVSDTITIAHVGDSRAVLVNRNGKVRSLCEEHRLNRRDEQERVERAGGLVINSSGTPRVNGVLALSRAIGDEKYKEFIIAQPEISTIHLVGNEEFLIVASDGLWDVVSDESCAEIVWKILNKKKIDSSSAEEQAAKALTQYAWDQGSNDDASVIVLDLRKYLEELQSCNENEDIGVNSSLDDTTASLERLSMTNKNEIVEMESVTPMSTRANVSKDANRRPW